MSDHPTKATSASTDRMTSPEKDLLAAVGHALANWSAVELQLGIVFGQASQMPRDKARSMFDGIVSFEVRLHILDTIMALEAVDEIEAEMWARMSARLSKAYKKRHELAHFVPVFDNPSKPAIGPFCTYDKLHKGTLKQLDRDVILERGRRFAELVTMVSWFALRAERRHAPPGIAPQLDLEAHPAVAPLRALAIQTLEARRSQPPKPEPGDGW